MGDSLTDSLLPQISLLVTARMGLHFPTVRWRDLERGIASAASASGFPDAHTYSQWLLSAPPRRDQIEELASHLTVGETYFFREKSAFDALREQILPELIYARHGTTRQLRIWSAGCCSGEEAYSSAIVLSQLIPDWQKWMLTILATDINPHFLHKAAAGVYGEWSFRDVSSTLKERYFTQKAANRFEIIPSIRQLVTFSRLNLVEDIYPSPLNNTQALDLILCRNVLMYFSPEQARKVVRNLYDSLAEGGWLIVGQGEISHTLFSDFKMVRYKDAILYQKKRALQPDMHDQVHDQVHGEAPPTLYDISSPGPSFRRVCKEESPVVSARAEGIPPVGRNDNFASQSPSQESHSPESYSPESPSPESPSQALYEQGDYAEAEAQAHRELAEDTEGADKITSLLLLARIHANQGKLDEALAWCRRSIAADCLNLSAHYLHATIQEARGEIEEAITSFKRVLYLHAEFVLAHFALGCLARRQGKQREAEKHFANMLGSLRAYRQEEMVPESNGLTAGQLIEMLHAASRLGNLSEKISEEISGKITENRPELRR